MGHVAICRFACVNRRTEEATGEMGSGSVDAAEDCAAGADLFVGACGPAQSSHCATSQNESAHLAALAPSFLQGGVAGLEHEPSRKTSSQRTKDDQIKAIVEATLHTKPEDATHWSSRTLADQFGVSHMTVARIRGQSRFATPSRSQFQTVPRQAVCGKAHRCGRVVSQSGPTGRWSYAWTKNLRSKPWTERNPGCR